MGKFIRLLWHPLGLLYIVASAALLLFSYTQVDLSLTLSRASVFQTVQKAFQYIGYYQRPLATGWYIAILSCFFILYVIVVRAILARRLTLNKLWGIIGAVAIILVFSYPAFSYDFFNYMFTAKTVLVYHKNPYAVTPLQFTGVEPWLSFMHWTHLASAYTPLWIVLTLPAYLLGFGYFLLIMWNIKILIAAFYLATIWFLYKILEKKDKEHATLGVALFALNPLIILETLVAGHNDIVMMALAMLSMYFFMQSMRWASFVLLALSVAVKLMTIFLLPVFFFNYRRRHALIAMMVGFVLVLFQREVLGWYWVWIMPFVALLPRNRSTWIVATGVSLGLLLRYAPFFYFGHWDPPVPTIKFWVTIIPIIVSILIALNLGRFRRLV